MGRPEAPITSYRDDICGFARDLRQLRRDAGTPTYRSLAARAGYAASSLSEAASGRRLPSLEVTLAFVAACDGDVACWQERWRRLSAATAPEPAEAPFGRAPGGSAGYRGEGATVASGDEVGPTPSIGRFRTRNRLVVATVLTMLLTVLAAWTMRASGADPARAAVNPSARTARLHVAEGADPHDAGCDRGQVDNLAPVGLYTVDRFLLGTVMLRWSALCRMAWVRFEPTIAFDKLGGGTVTIEGRRPADGHRDRFELRLPTGLAMWGNVLDPAAGCLTAWARVVLFSASGFSSASPAPGTPLPVEAETSCVRPS